MNRGGGIVCLNGAPGAAPASLNWKSPSSRHGARRSKLMPLPESGCIRCWMLNVGRSMFPVFRILHSAFILPFCFAPSVRTRARPEDFGARNLFRFSSHRCSQVGLHAWVRSGINSALLWLRNSFGATLRHEPPGSAGVPPASRELKTGTRRRDASAPRNCAPAHGPDARIQGWRSKLPPKPRGSPALRDESAPSYPEPCSRTGVAPVSDFE